MAKRAPSLPVPAIVVTKTSPLSLRHQLYVCLRDEIVKGQLVTGQRLPSSRAFAKLLGISRNTVLETYERLAAVGYLNGRVGSGTRVARPVLDTYLSELPRQSKSSSRDFRRVVQDSLYPASVARLEDCDGNCVYLFSSD